VEYIHLSGLNLYVIPFADFVSSISEGVHSRSVWYTLVWAVHDSLPRVN